MGDSGIAAFFTVKKKENSRSEAPMNRRGPEPSNDYGASEVIGIILLVSMIVLAFGIVSLVLVSQPQKTQIPEISAVIDNITNQSTGQNYVYITHSGGDALKGGEYLIFVNNIDRTPLIAGNGALDWNVGDILTVPMGNETPGLVQIYYRGPTESDLLVEHTLSSITPVPTTISPPVITGVSPANGPLSGGTPVMISGFVFDGVMVVRFVPIVATNFTVLSDNTIIASSPPGSGTVDIAVTSPSGTSAVSTADRFTYVPPPTFTSVSPASGPVSVQTTVTISGTGFTGATAVTFGGTPAVSFVVNSDTSITAITPARTSAGPVTIIITAPGGSATGTNAFTYNNITVKSFTTVGTSSWTVPQGVSTIEYLVVAGGGGGGRYGGGGGAGGFLSGKLFGLSGSQSVIVGSGGAGSKSSATGTSGGNSVFATITAAGGGGGGSGGGSAFSGLSGGSGGGAVNTGAAGIASPPGQGNAGGTGINGGGHYMGGGGGGAAATGGAPTGTSPNYVGGTGGNGISSNITGNILTYAGGGGGGGYKQGSSTGGSGGSGGGGGGAVGAKAGTAGTANTGGGGGGGGNTGNGGNGGSGIIVIRYY